jgi:MFS family permease
MFSYLKNHMFQGASSIANLGSFIFGISGVIISLVVVIAPFKILQIVSNDSIKFLGFELEKNGALGVLLISGVVTAAITQPIAGNMSDKIMTKFGKRLPFMMASGFGTSISIITLYYIMTFPLLILCWIIIQFFANFGEGPANALLKDHVSEKKFGEASGKFNLLRVLGAVFTLIIVLQLMNIYYRTLDEKWFLAGLIFLSALLSLSTIWSYFSLKNIKLIGITQTSIDNNNPNRTLNLFLIVLTFSITLTAFSSLQSYAYFLLRDILILENPTNMMTYVIIVLGLSVGLSIVPAGKLSDKYNRKFIIYGGGISGGLSCFLIIAFHSPVMVLILCCGIGVAVGSMFGTIWALTNDVISKKNAGKQIGLLSFGFLFSGIAARGAGIIIDYLNNLSQNLGYFSLIGLAGLCFIIAPITASMIKTSNGN